MSPSETLRIAVEAQSSQDDGSGVVDKFCKEMKDSAALQYSWQDIVQSSAVASYAAAACVVASTSESAQKTQLERSDNLFSTMLKANLIECSNQCRIALLQSDKGFSMMKQATAIARNKTMDIIDCLSDPQAASRLLKPMMQQLSQTTNTCAQQAVEINTKYDDWFAFTSALYAACVAIEGSEDEKKKAGDYTLIYKQSRIENVEVNAAAEKLGKQIDSASETFKKASDAFPAGWQILGGAVARGLADSIASATTQFQASCASSFNVNMRSVDGRQLQQSPYPAEDPAYNSVQKDLPFLHCLVKLTDGPDWKQVAGSIDFLVNVLSNAQEQFKAVATTGSASSDLLKVYANAVEVASAMKKANGTADPEQIKSWQGFKAQYIKAVELFSVARGLPGSSPLSLPILSADAEDKQVAAQADATSVPALAVVEDITNQWTAVYAVRQNLKPLYEKRSQLLDKQEKQLLAVTAKLNSLCGNKMGLAEIKAVLETNLKVIINMKLSAVSTYAFFKSLAATSDAAMKYTVTPFVADIQAQKAAKVGSYTYSDHLRSSVFQQIMILGAQYAVISEASSVYVEMSQRYMLPSMQLLDRMSMTGSEPDMQRRSSSDLKGLIEGGISYARELANRKQEQLFSGLEQRTGDAEAVTKRLPPTAESKQAVQTGTGIANRAADEALNFNASAKPLMKDL